MNPFLGVQEEHKYLVKLSGSQPRSAPWSTQAQESWLANTIIARTQSSKKIKYSRKNYGAGNVANNRSANKILIDATGVAVEGIVKVAYILFTPNSANDEILIRDTASGDDSFYLRAAVAKDTKYFDFSRAPLVFANGIYIQTLTSGAKAVIVTTTGTTLGGG